MQYVNLKEASKVLPFDLGSLYHLAAKGRLQEEYGLPFRKFGNRWLIPLHTRKAWFRERYGDLPDIESFEPGA